MSSDDSDYDGSICSKPSTKIIKIDPKFMQSFNNHSTTLSYSLTENVENSVFDEVYHSYDDETIETNNYFGVNILNSNDNESIFSEESFSDKTIKYGGNETDCSPISDYDFGYDDDFELKSDVETCEDLQDEEDINEYIIYDKTTKSYKSAGGVDNDEVDDLLDKTFKHKEDNPNENKKKGITPEDFNEYEKVVLEEVCKNHFDILPENWIEATHKSGMPIFLHKKSRVVTLSRPYFLGPGDPKTHLAPLSAISCLQYRKGIASQENIKNEPDFQTCKLGDMVIPNAKVETAQENIIKESLTHEELREYCKSLFRFKGIETVCEKPVKEIVVEEICQDTQEKTKERPSLPDSTKLISFPVQTEDHDKRCNRRREWIMNPNGKSYVSILHEYLQQALKTQPWYEFKELDNPELPYSATVVLNDVQYGVGIGNSKKQAKLNAAQATLDILIPEMKSKIDSEHQNKADPIIFDQIKVTDPRITEFCAKTTEPSPYAMLLVCLQRNFGECEISIEYKLNNRRRMLNQCSMTVGKHSASVACKNKRDGKQKASQIILGLLHPHIDNWGSLLRLYGNRSIKNAKEKKQEEQEITQLQSKAAVNQPNYAILEKLKEEMLKISRQRKLKEVNNIADSLPQSLLATTCPYTIEIPSTSNSKGTKLRNDLI